MSLPDVLTLLGVLLAVGLSTYLVHRYWPNEKRKQHTDVAGFIFAGVAVLYAVLLAFVVVSAWEGLNSARATTYSEADQLSNVYWIARSFPLPQSAAIDGLALDYARTVTDREWPLMDKGKSSPQAQVLLNQVRADVFAFTPRSRQQQVLYEQAVVGVDGLTAARRDRLNAMSEVVPEPIWVALIVGGVVTVGFCLLFGLENRAVHIMMVVGIAALIAISLLLIKNMQHVYSGNPRIGPEAFEGFLNSVPPPR